VQVEISLEAARGCGFRRTGKDGFGLYLVGGAPGEPCERLPFPLTACPCCGAGIKFTRSMTQIDATSLFAETVIPFCTSPMGPRGKLYVEPQSHHHYACPLCNPHGVDGWLMWVGRQHYTAPGFMREAAERGISKRIGALPRDFKVGESWVYLAHLDAVGPWLPQYPEREAWLASATPGEFAPMHGVITVYRPRLEVVVNTTDLDELPEYAKKLAEKHGARLVKVVRNEPVQTEIPETEEE